MHGADSNLQVAYRRLLEHYGRQNWWPGDSPFEVMVGAVLVQNTNWQNAARAIETLKDEGLLAPDALVAAAQEELQELIRPAGYFRQKAARLQSLARFVTDNYGGSLEAMFAEEFTTLRAGLLSINGIGPETADSILLYAGGLPTFVIDTYTHRVVKRHGWAAADADYHALKEHFENALDRDAALFNEYHALLVRVGKEHCRTAPRCEGCPLAELLPEGGPVQPEN